MTATDADFAQSPEDIKLSLVEKLKPLVCELVDVSLPQTSQRDLERSFVKKMFGFMCLVFALMMSVRAYRAAQKDIQARGLDPSQVSWRLEKTCWRRLNTTFGRIAYPVWTYREINTSTPKTRTPAATLDPLHAVCRSSLLLLERETRLGSDHPFRVSQLLLRFYTQDAVNVEDTTIAAHTYAVGRMVKRHYLYRTREETREVLRDRATIDRETGQPILHASIDAHVLRRFVDDTAQAEWKNANGLRFWCVDRRSGELIHIGGEYTWGDCEQVERIVKEVISSGIVPADGNYGDGVVARIVWVTDGAPWFETRVFPLFPHAVLILDPFHAIDHIAKFAMSVWGQGTDAARAFIKRAREAVLGAPDAPRTKCSKRKRAGQGSRLSKAQRRIEQANRTRAATKDARPILALLGHLKIPDGCKEALKGLVGYITRNAYRMDYARYIKAGFQIGSGAMESLHRVASQIRLKRAGPGWLPETAQAIFNLRMMVLAGRWEAFWSQPGLAVDLVESFRENSPKNKSNQGSDHIGDVNGEVDE